MMREHSRHTLLVCVVAAICAAAGCDREAPASIEVVVGNDFRGLVAFKPSQPGGVAAEGSKSRVIVPPSGDVKLAGANPFFGSHSLTVRRENGESVALDYRQVIADNVVAWRNVGPVPREGGWSTDSAYCVGTKADALAAYRQIWEQDTSQAPRAAQPIEQESGAR